MANRIPVVNASDIGKAAYCPHALCLQKRKNRTTKQAARGIREHEKLNKQLLVPGDRRCFVASYALGVDHPATESLRIWRDNSLLPHASGRLLIRAYYWASPKLIGIFGTSRLIKRASAMVVLAIAKHIEAKT